MQRYRDPHIIKPDLSIFTDIVESDFEEVDTRLAKLHF